MKNISVADIMTREIISVKPTTSLLECAKVFVKKRIGSVLVVDKKKLVGFITQRDILWALIKKNKKELSKIKVIDISRRKIATIKPSASLDEAIKKMKKLKFRRLPVIKRNEIVGIVTIRDILTYNPQVYPELDELKQIREESEKLKRIKKAKSREFIHNGICEECGATDILQRIDERLLCNDCASLI